MNPIRTLANLYGCIAYAIGPERWIPRLTQRVLCSVRTKEKKIALTFDDGPNPKYTPLLLTKLAEHCVSATFFLIGRNLKRHPEIGRRIVQEGHEVGNHTYNHRSLPFLFKARNLSEKQVKVDKDLRRAAAERFFVFRGIPHFVPGGEIRKSLLEFGLILGQPPSVP